MATELKYRVRGMDRSAALNHDGTVTRKATMRVVASGTIGSIGMPMEFAIPDIPSDMVSTLDAGDEVTLTITKIVPVVTEPTTTEPTVG